MTPADELRTAACALRARAAKTEAGLAAALREGTRDLFGQATPDRAAMHPEVGGTLADWLEQAAHHYECGIRAADDVFRDDPAGREAFLTTGPGAPSPHALAVARAILGDQP